MAGRELVSRAGGGAGVLGVIPLVRRAPPIPAAGWHNPPWPLRGHGYCYVRDDCLGDEDWPGQTSAVCPTRVDHSVHDVAPVGNDMIDALRWVHVSDFHFGGYDDDGFTEKVACDALLADLETRIASEPPSFAVITGDVAYSGQVQEYEAASSFLAKFAEVIQLPRERLFFVPGNHDCDRTKAVLAYEGARTLLSSEASVDRLLSSTEQVEDLLRRQEAFWNFVKDFTQGQTRLPICNGLGYVSTLEFSGLRLTISGLNSAWLCGQDFESSHLVLGERQLIEAATVASTFSPHVRLALTHHPLGWMQEWDQSVCRMRRRTDWEVHHRGHLHETAVDMSGISDESRCVLISAGSAHATRFYGNAYNLVDMDVWDGRFVVSSFRYLPSSGVYEPTAPAHLPISSRAAVLVDGSSLESALASMDSDVAPHARYLADLLSGRKSDVPVLVNGQVEFVNPNVALGVEPEGIATSFLRLSNAFRFCDSPSDCSELLRQHIDVVRAFAQHLEAVRRTSDSADDRLSGGSHTAAKTATRPNEHSHALLEELQGDEDWQALELAARKMMDSADASLAAHSERMLAEALMRSDEATHRREAVELAQGIAARSEASPEDLLRLAAAFEAADATDRATAVTIDALNRWGDDFGLRQYARSLALADSSGELARLLKASDGGANES